MVLSDGELLDAIEKGKITITPFSEDCLTPNGYDLHIGGIEHDDTMITWTDEYQVDPKTDFRIVTMETIRCDASHVGFLHLKSRYARRGIQATFGKVDAGFWGTLTLGMFNGSKYSYPLKKGDKIVQIDFRKMNKPAQQLYEQRSGNYQHQKEKVIK